MFKLRLKGAQQQMDILGQELQTKLFCHKDEGCLYVYEAHFPYTEIISGDIMDLSLDMSKLFSLRSCVRHLQSARTKQLQTSYAL